MLRRVITLLRSLAVAFSTFSKQTNRVLTEAVSVGHGNSSETSHVKRKTIAEPNNLSACGAVSELVELKQA